MEEKLTEILDSYRVCTLEIMDAIKRDDLNVLSNLIKEREVLVEKASSLTFNDEMKKIYKEFKLENLQQELNGLMRKKLMEIKKEIAKLDKIKEVNGAYNNLNMGNPKIFNKKI